MKASERQEGGQHYKDFPIQPAEFCQRNRLNWCEANVVKYVCRHRDKKGAEDLRKAKHYIDLLLEWEYSSPLPDGEGAAPLVKDATAESLCHTCQRNKGCIGDYPRTRDGGCEGYCLPPITVPPPAPLRERILDAKQEAPKPSLCHSCHIIACTARFIAACEATGECNLYVPEAKQEAPTAAEQPLDFTLPSIALKCTAEEAAEKFWSEREEWKAAEKDSLHELVERWDCLQALYTFAERGGDVEWYQDHVRVVMEDLARCHADRRDVMKARRELLWKNAKRGYYAPEINAEIIASGGHSFTPKEADA